MNIPSFTAEASLYQTKNHYQGAVSGSFQGAGNATVTPQACGWIKGITCGAAIAGGTALCTAACLSGPAACAGCWAGALAIVGYGFCRDCIPGWMRSLINVFESGGGGGTSGGGGSGGGGGGVPRRCCERDEFGKCLISVPRNAECP